VPRDGNSIALNASSSAAKDSNETSRSCVTSKILATRKWMKELLSAETAPAMVLGMLSPFSRLKLVNIVSAGTASRAITTSSSAGT